MKTLIKGNVQAQEKIKNERRKLSNAVKSRENPREQNAQVLEFKQKDYQDLIEIKSHRSDRWKRNSKMFFSIGLALVLFVVNVAFNWKFVDTGAVDELTLLQNAEFDELMEVPNTEQPPPPPPQILKQPVIIEVPDEQVLEDVDIDLDVEVTEEMVIEQVEFDELIIDEEEADEIFQIVEHSPEPQGGYKAFYEFVNQNIRYPQDALRMHISGRVFVKFVVDKQGNVTNVQAVKGIGGGCDEEAVRIISKSPRWKPGKQRGRPVSVYMMLPITFVLN